MSNDNLSILLFVLILILFIDYVVKEDEKLSAAILLALVGVLWVFVLVFVW